VAFIISICVHILTITYKSKDVTKPEGI
jgi:hypothetical protein